jgi:PAS domain S-box-containing protein
MNRRINAESDAIALSQAGQSLRRRAEDHLLAKQKALNYQVPPILEQDLQSPQAMQNILHQLQVHQIELEMQNEELRRTQLDLVNARVRYFDLYNLAPVGHCTMTIEGNILESNLMTATLFGREPGTFANESITQFIVSEDQDIFYHYRTQLIESGESQTCELRMIAAASTTPFWASLTSVYENDLDTAPLLRVVITNITERKEAAAELALLHQQLQAYNRELRVVTHDAEMASIAAQKATLAKSDFLSSMSHELRSPLSAILGFAQLLESGTPPPTPGQKRSIEQILKAGWYLLDLINEILDLALIESGKLTVCMAPVLLRELILDCHAIIERQAEKRSIQLNFSCSDKDDHQHSHTPLVVHADYTRLKQVLINLLSNAIKYNRVNGFVTVTATRVKSDRIRISVKDTGQGLTPEHVEQLFQPFNRLGQENLNQEGTGIGLVISKRLTELMGGEIGLESTLGVGSTFWLELNLAEANTCPSTDLTANRLLTS